jgi:predicted nucleic acid-binding Zn ribbon protein
LSINNLEQEKKREVEREIKEKNKLIKRRKNTRTVLKLAIFALLFVMVYFGLCVGSKRMIYSDSLESSFGAENEYSEQMRAPVQKAVNGGLVGNFKPSFSRYEKIQKSIVAAHPEVDKVDAKFNFWKMATEVKLKVEIPIISWKIAEGRAAYVNEKGEVFEPPASLVALFKPLEIAGTGLGATNGQSVPINNDKLKWIVAVVPEIQKSGIEELIRLRHRSPEEYPSV